MTARERHLLISYQRSWARAYASAARARELGYFWHASRQQAAAADFSAHARAVLARSSVGVAQ